MAHLQKMRIFSEKPLIIFMHPLAPYIVQNFKKTLIADQSYDAQNGPFALNIFFRKTNNMNPMYLVAFSIVQNFKKKQNILREDRTL